MRCGAVATSDTDTQVTVQAKAVGRAGPPWLPQALGATLAPQVAPLTIFSISVLDHTGVPKLVSVSPKIGIIGERARRGLHPSIRWGAKQAQQQLECSVRREPRGTPPAPGREAVPAGPGLSARPQDHPGDRGSARRGRPGHASLRIGRPEEYTGRTGGEGRARKVAVRPAARTDREPAEPAAAGAGIKAPPRTEGASFPAAQPKNPHTSPPPCSASSPSSPWWPPPAPTTSSPSRSAPWCPGSTPSTWRR